MQFIKNQSVKKRVHIFYFEDKEANKQRFINDYIPC